MPAEEKATKSTGRRRPQTNQPPANETADKAPGVIQLHPDGPERSNADICNEVCTRMNERWAVVRIGTSTAILDTAASGFSVMTKTAFFDLHAHRKVWLRKGKSQEAYSEARVWFEHAARRTYEGVVFLPGKPAPAGYYNLWQGWPYEADASAGTCKLFLEHIRENVCQGDPERTRWVLSFLADVVQYPDRKLGVSLVLQGEQGTGKSTIGDVMGRLLGAHSTMVDQERHIVGHFNAHLETCLLLRAEEATWAGDKAAAGVLKSLITGESLMIERKGHEPVAVRNYCRVLFSSNSDWVVPAGTNDRRFTVLEVAQHRMQDHRFFAALWAELEANDGGGFRALMAYLQSYRVDEAFLRRTLNTDELLAQKLHTLDSPHQWWYEILMTGELPGGDGNAVRRDELWRNYVEFAGLTGQRHRSAQTQLGMMLKRLAPGLRTKESKQASGYGKLQSVYTHYFPPLAECRRVFATSKLGSTVRWRRPDSDWCGAEDPFAQSQPADSGIDHGPDYTQDDLF